MTHRSKEELVAMIHHARLPGIGSLWVHKLSGKFYEVVGGCMIEDGLKPAVLYRERRDPTGFVWCRPAAEWNERFRRTNGLLI